MTTGINEKVWRILSNKVLLATVSLAMMALIAQGMDNKAHATPLLASDAPPLANTASDTKKHIRTGTSPNSARAANANKNTRPSKRSAAPNVAGQANTKTRLTLLQPRAEPYALMAGTGIVKVRFNVRTAGDADQSGDVYLRQSDGQDRIAMNDQGLDGDVQAGDGIYGATIPIDTSTLQQDTCLSYESFVNFGHAETISSPFKLCVSAFPIRVATSDTEHIAEFADGSKAISDEVLLTVNRNTSTASIQRLASEINATVVGSIPSLNLYQLKLPAPFIAGRLLELVAQLNMHSEVKATINAIGNYTSVPNDTEYGNQHGLQLIRAQDAWNIGANGNGVIVTVLDNGLDRTHPDFGLAKTDPAYVSPSDCQLAENDCVVGVNDDTGPKAGHGTQVAGIIAAKTNNKLGVASVAYGSKIHAIRTDLTVDIANPLLTFARIAAGFDDAASYVASHRTASVINASFSFPSSGANWDAVCTAINNAVLEGPMDPASGLNTGIPRAIVVNAVGNNGLNGYYYPARCNDYNAKLTRKDLFITVANSTSSATIDPSCANATAIDQRCGGTTTGVNNTSNYGAWVDIAAPGMSIITANAAGGYTTQTGTSFSAPMVSGAAAILKSCGTPLDKIESTLRNSANVMVSFPDGSYAPRLDIYRALRSRNVAPTAVNLSNNRLGEGVDTSSGVEVGTLTATDLNICDKHSYSIAGGSDAAKFSIGGVASDRLKLTDGVLNPVAKPNYSVKVRVTDYFGATYDQALTVSVGLPPAPPTNLHVIVQ